MTVADNTSRNQYTATSGQTVFAYTFEIVDKDDIVVLKNGTTLSEGTNYTVSNVGNDSGGNVTLTVGATAGDILTLYRDMPYARTQNYTNSGDFLASEVNSDFDNLWLAGEQTNRSFSQSIRKPITDSDSISMELPAAASRTNSFLTFDSTGAVSTSPLASANVPTAMTRQQFTGNGSTTVFTLAADPGSSAAVVIYIDGVYQEEGTYSVSGSTVTFTEAPPTNASIEVVLYRVTDIGTTDANSVTYLPAGTGAVQTTVQTKLRESVSVKDFGAVGDGVTDDTAAIQAAITYCKANNKSLYSGSENNHLITSQIDLRSVKGVFFDCTISHATDDFIPVVIGHESTQLFEYTFNINRIVWTNQPGSGETKSNLATNPQLRIVGLKNAYVFVGSVDYIQLYADSDDATTQSTAYNTIQIIFSYLVEFDTNPSPTGSTIQWINGNKFLPGRIQRITMDGTYSHNNNIFYAQEMETNGEITLTTGFSNKFYDFRFEGTGITVTFGTGHNNYVRQSYAEVNYSSVGPGSPTVTQGTGAANIFIRDYEQFIDKVVMFGLSNGETVDGVQKNFYQQYVDKSGDQWDANSTFTTIFETDYIPCVAGIGFNFESDQTMWRPKVTFYDASLNQITSASDPELLDGQVLTWSSVSNAYVIASNISEIDALMVTATSGYFKVEVVTGSTLPVFDYVNLIGYCPKGHNGEALAAMSPKYKSGLISATAAEIADATNAINTTDKYAGKQVWVSNAYKTVFAATNLATGTWRFSDGTTAYTPT